MKGKSMAILPFRVGNNAETARIAEVLFDQVHAELASAQSLVVVSKTSSSRFQNSTKSISTIASDLRVSHVMAGSVTREHDNLHPSGTYQSRE
jgi:TolB-like protein